MTAASDALGPRRPCIDFHFHSVYSNDAFGVPADYIAQAAAQDVVAIAPTEHDNTDSLAKYVAAAQSQKANLRIFSGVEIDTDSERWGHFHMLAFFFDPRHAGLQAILKREVDSGMARLEAVAAAMRKAGEAIDLPAAFARYRSLVADRAVGPKALWQWLEHTGRAKTFADAKKLYAEFDKQIPRGPRPTDIQTVMNTVHTAGGICVLAHPGDEFSEKDIEAMFELGLDGVEVFHMTRTDYMQRWRAVAQARGWPMSGGSDNHEAVANGTAPWPTYASAELLPGLFAACKKRHGREPKPAYAPAG